MNKPKFPCVRECEGRTMGCHGKCEKYQAYSKEQAEWRNWFNQNRIADLEKYATRWRKRGVTPYEAYGH